METVIFIPGYREVTEGMLAKIRDLRARGIRPMSTMPEVRWQELMAYAEKKISKAKEIEAEARLEPSARERYKARLDDARRAIYLTRDEPYARAGKRLSETQANRRKGKPATDAYLDADRNTRIVAAHDRRVAGGHGDATAWVANEFGLSSSQVRRIVASARA